MDCTPPTVLELIVVYSIGNTDSNLKIKKLIFLLGRKLKYAFIKICYSLYIYMNTISK